MYMYQIFNQLYESGNSVIKPPGFELIKRTYQNNIDSIIQYFNNRVIYIKSNHLLARLLTSSNIPFEYNLDRYEEAAYARSPYIAKYFQLTSEINYGEIFDGVFYGPGNHEIIVYTETYFDSHEALKNWRQLRPINVIEHPFSDLGLIVPNGRDSSTGSGLCVISIDIPLLLIQYRGFVREQQIRLREHDSLLGVSHFIAMYVLPNMLYSHIELVILNRLMNLYYHAPMDASTRHYPFPIINYADKIDKILLNIIDHIKDTRMLYTSMLKNIPSIYQEDMQSSLILPDLARTRQVWWAMLISRLRVMKFLIDIGGDKARHNNMSYINKLRIDLKRLLEDNVLRSVLNKDMYYDYTQLIEQLM